MADGRAKRVFFDGLGKNNPVFVQILGICSTLAVTNKLENTFIMCVGLVFVTTLSSFTVSALRKWIPSRIRMMVEVLIIASFVIMVDIYLHANMIEVWRQLGPYVGLIITNCIVMGRCEAFALSNPPGLSALDGFVCGMGYSYVLLGIAFFRELLGTGAVWGVRVMPAAWVNWNIMVMPPGAFFMLAIFIWAVRTYVVKTETKGTKP